jgi:phenylalanine-4-hydroxylase
MQELVDEVESFDLSREMITNKKLPTSSLKIENLFAAVPQLYLLATQIMQIESNISTCCRPAYLVIQSFGSLVNNQQLENTFIVHTTTSYLFMKNWKIFQL